ncbi:protein YLS3-like [Tripterygium wilfordii]|uniref:Protein YLS3-like n=1 Tax=Tripterygium wilfordii TaxID=458696 RepID=A0A7J7CQV1_TRIWF|nr:non-specific lipid transfer protein GPI-anchored 13-like [Tripterygium wilfordii]KAF5736388.1 protein YLS3-like [Tripterygium wilfordii]
MGSFSSGQPLPVLLVLVLVSSIHVDISMADSSKDREECADQLVGLATCLPYVGGEAKSPTPDCCSGLKQVLKSNKKCLCVVIRDRNVPELGLNINATLALGLPTACHTSANVSKCPELLHLPPNSPEAQVFYQLSNGSNHTNISPAISPTGEGASSSTIPRPESTGHCYRNGRWFWLDIVVGGVLFLCFMNNSSYLFM